MLSTADLRLTAIDELHSGRPGLFRTLAGDPANQAAARGILAAADMDAFRFEQNGFTPFEGLLQHAPSVARLAQKYSPDHQFSATQLERYATCPFRFLQSDVLKLEPNDSIEPEIDPRKRGLSLHRVLADLHRAGADRQSGAQPDRSRVDRSPARTRRGRVLRRGRISPHTSGHSSLLNCNSPSGSPTCIRRNARNTWQRSVTVGTSRLRLGLSSWPLAISKIMASLLRNRPRPAPCVTFGPDDAPVRVRGRIDRVDVGRRGGKQAFTVIDYKTRWTPRYQFADIEMGLALQLAIYASAARRSGLLDPEASVFQMAYWTLTLGGCVVGLKGKSKSLEMLSPELVDDIERTLHDVLPKITERSAPDSSR